MSSEQQPYCIFCEIVARRSPANIAYEDDEYIVFQNRLRWVPLMLLVVPKKHLTQEEFWADVGRAGKLAEELGKKLAPGGFRLLSNFGADALQTVQHGHIHLLGGAHLGLYV